MNRIVLAFTLILTAPAISKAQTAADSVKAAINLFFDGMRNADASMVKASFADSAILQTVVVNREGKVSVRNEPITGFADVLSKQKKGDLDERIEFETIKIDGPMATVWTPYKFYFQGNFSHCGVNSFQLVKLNGTWKIQYIIDTRRRQGCE
jgi:hypothetical protein